MNERDERDSRVKPLRAYEHVGRMLAPRLFRHFRVDPEGADLREVFAAHPQLVLAFNHGPSAGPILVVAGYLRAIEQAGAGERRHFGVTYLSIAELNGIENPDLIYPGQVFKIPN